MTTSAASDKVSRNLVGLGFRVVSLTPSMAIGLPVAVQLMV